MNSTRLCGVLLAVVALFPVALTSAASAEVRPSTLTLTIAGQEGTLRMALLRCDPPGGSHPQPWWACAELTDAGGDFTQLEEQLIMCTMEFRPVTAGARGLWDGELVVWKREFSNPCTMRAATGTVFAF